MRILRVVLLGVLAIGVAIAQTAPSNFSECRQPAPVQIKPIGHPIWMPVDFHVFTAATGPQENPSAQFKENMINLLYPRRHEWCDPLGIVPGDPHQPPYLKEMEAGLDIMNFRESAVFHVADFSLPNSVWAAWMTVPMPGTTGSSPDFSSGPIIPNTLFPIHLAGETYRNNVLWDPYLGTFDVPPTTGLLCSPFDVDGHSHFPVFYAENSFFGPGGPVTGYYQFRITMTDTTGNGWSITVGFTVQK
jgi:hypothetical protein